MDGIRGVAAIVVMIGHAQQLLVRLPDPRFRGAVDLFFVMSSFVLARTYEPRFAAGMGPRAFALNRWVRLYPLYVLGTIIGIASVALTIQLSRS